MWQQVISPYGIFNSAIIAFFPLLWLILSLGWLKVPAFKACLAGLLISVMIAILAWGMPAILTLRAVLEGTVLALWPIIWVIIAALFTYNVCIKTGAMDKIRTLMASLSGDRRIQAILLAWGLGGFLEGAAGFGTAVTIPASILSALGFNPFFAAIICLIANTAPTAFGAVGIPVTTLAKITDIDVMPLTYDVTMQLTPFVIFLPLVLVLIMTKSLAGLKGVWFTALLAGVSFAITQLLLAKYVGPELTAIVGAAVSIFSTALWAKYFPPAVEWKFSFEQKGAGAVSSKETSEPIDRTHLSFREQLIAWSPYILLFVLILGTSKFVPIINKPLSQLQSLLFIYTGPHGKPLAIDWLVTPGTLIIIATVIGGLLQGASLSVIISVFVKTIAQLQKTIITIIAIVSMAKVMGYSGMVAAIAIALAKVTGPFYPAIAPAIGALGTFVTGSDTSSNVLFGELQKQTALEIGADPTWIASANMTGATAGKMISPQSISIATSATNQSGKEGELLAVTIKYCLAYVAILGIIVYGFG